MGYTAKQKSLAIIPKLTGLLSFLGSTYILFDVLISPKKRSNSVYHRIVLFLSISDMIASIVNILSTWPIPSSTPNVYGAIGTTATCTAQGLFNEMGNIATPLFNVSLCTYYYAVIRRGWPEHRIQKIERRFYIPPILVGLFMGCIGLPFELYNNSGWLCWIAPYPSGCHKVSFSKKLSSSCQRGEYANLFRWIHYTIIWSAIFYVTIGMFLIYVEVKNKENRTRRFTVHESPQMREEMMLAIQRAAEEALAEEEEEEEKEESDVVVSHDDHGVHFSSEDEGCYLVENDEESSSHHHVQQQQQHENSDDFSDQENLHSNGTHRHHHDAQQEQNMYNETQRQRQQQQQQETNAENSEKSIFLNRCKRRKKKSNEQHQERRRQEQEQQRVKKRNKKSKARKVADQAMLFVGALYLTWIFTTLTRIFQITQGKTHYPLLVLMAIFFPLQGFFNACIYLRPRYLRVSSAFPEMPLHKVIYYVLKYHDEDNVLFLKQGSGRVGSGASAAAAGGGGGGGRLSTLRSSNSMNSFFNFNTDSGSRGWFSVRMSGAYNNASQRMSGISRRMSDSSLGRRMSSGLSLRQMSSGRFSTGSGRFSSRSSEENNNNDGANNKKVHNDEIAEVIRRGEEMATREEVEMGDRTTTIRWEEEQNDQNEVIIDQSLEAFDTIIGDNDEEKCGDCENENEKRSNDINNKQEDKCDDNNASMIFDDDKHTTTTTTTEYDQGKEYILSKKE